MTIKVFVSHMNREDELTQMAHQFCDFLEKNGRFSVWRDTEEFGQKRVIQESKIEEIIKRGISKSQIFVIIFFPDNELSRDLSEWLEKEEKKAINASMPVLEIYLHNAKQKQILEPNLLNYRKRYYLRFGYNEKWMEPSREKLFEIAREYNLG